MTGIANKRNKLSSATGAGQFLDDTWLEAVRTHRRDLIKGRSDRELLKLRRDAELTREIITRLVEQLARTLQKRSLPLTSGSLYLAYFAGPAGAVALLSGAEHTDAASVMAAADAAGRTTRRAELPIGSTLSPRCRRSAARMPLLDRSRSNMAMRSGPLAETGQGRMEPTGLRL